MTQLGALGTKRVGRTTEGRPIIQNPDGSHSTERSITGPWGPKGEWTNIPSMFGGKQVSEEEAVRIMRRNNWVDPETGRKAQFYPSLEEAERAAQQRSSGELGKYGGGNLAPAPAPTPKPQSFNFPNPLELLFGRPAQAADPRNPFDPTVIRGPWRASPQGEGGGGGLAPRPPNRFQEIMDKAPKEKLPTRHEIRRAADRGEIEPTKARELEARLRDPTMTVYKPEGLGVKGSATGAPQPVAPIPPPKPPRNPDLIGKDPRYTGAASKRQGDYAEDYLIRRGKHEPEGSFMQRRDVQLQRDYDAKEATRNRDAEIRTQEHLTLIQQRRAERGAAADRWLAQRQGPRELTPDLQRERAAEARLGTEIAPPTKDYRGFIRETMELGSIVTNPRSGYSQFDMILPGGSPIRVPFKTRGEALEFAARKPTAQEAAAKAALQRQRLGMAHGQSTPPQFTE